MYSQINRQWYYIYTCQTTEADKLPKVQALSVVLLARDFNPEKYESLCKILAKKYCDTGSPTSLLEAYLSVVTRGMCHTSENGKFSTSDYNIKHSYAKSNLSGIIEMFGLDFIILYTALLLKKKIAVYFPSHSLPELLQFTRSLPAFVWHRQNWNILYPYLDLDEVELKELKSSNHYVAGFTDASIEGRSDIYDVFVNGPSSLISIANHAKESMAMGKLHKDIAVHMVKCVESGDITDQQLIKEVATKTKELLSNLRSLAGDDGYISLEHLKGRKMPPATENFLFSLASCEGLVKMG